MTEKFKERLIQIMYDHPDLSTKQIANSSESTTQQLEDG